MKKFAVVVLLALGLLLGSCASNTVTPPPTTGAGGNWESQLLGGVGQASLLDFVSNFSVGSGGGPLTINSFSFFNVNSCFTAIASESGSAELITSASGQVTGTLNYTVTSGVTSTDSSSSTLTLTSYSPDGLTGTSSGTSGTTALRNGMVQGTWTLTGNTTLGCNGSGTFVLCQEVAPNSQGSCGSTTADREQEE